jgi:hypothetical protein
MRLSPLTRSALVLIPLLLCASRLHSQRGASSMQGMTQEVNRCLTIVRVAASRRRDRKNDRELDRFKSAGVASDGAVQFPPRSGQRKSA